MYACHILSTLVGKDVSIVVLEEWHGLLQISMTALGDHDCGSCSEKIVFAFRWNQWLEEEFGNHIEWLCG